MPTAKGEHAAFTLLDSLCHPAQTTNYETSDSRFAATGEAHVQIARRLGTIARSPAVMVQDLENHVSGC